MALAQTNAVAQQGCARCFGPEPCQFLCTTGPGTDFLEQEVCLRTPFCLAVEFDPSATCGEGVFDSCTLPLQACCLPGACYDLTAISCILAGGITTDGQPCPVAGVGGVCPPIPAPAPTVSALGMLGGLLVLLSVAAVAVGRRRRAP
jgi:hypothetical protein